MKEPQEKILGEQLPHPKANFKDTPLVKAFPFMVGGFIGFGSHGIYEAIGKITGWGTYTIATFCVGTLIAGIVGASIGGVSQVVINSFGNEVKG